MALSLVLTLPWKASNLPSVWGWYGRALIIFMPRAFMVSLKGKQVHMHAFICSHWLSFVYFMILANKRSRSHLQYVKFRLEKIRWIRCIELVCQYPILVNINQIIQGDELFWWSVVYFLSIDWWWPKSINRTHWKIQLTKSEPLSICNSCGQIPSLRTQWTNIFTMIVAFLFVSSLSSKLVLQSWPYLFITLFIMKYAVLADSILEGQFWDFGI